MWIEGCMFWTSVFGKWIWLYLCNTNKIMDYFSGYLEAVL